MLTKRTSKNQITLPKNVIVDFPDTEYFDVRSENGRIVLTPVLIHEPDRVRAKLAELGIKESDVAEAVQWARRQKK